MAVDVKTLTIGSHVDFNGRRVRIKAIVEDSVAFDYTQDEKQLYLSPNAYDEFLSPIPITPEILKELGFEWRKDSSCWRKYQNYDGERYDWGIYAYGSDGGTWCFSLYLPNFLIKPQLYAEHLHEIEGQLGYYGVELIKE